MADSTRDPARKPQREQRPPPPVRPEIDRLLDGMAGELARRIEVRHRRRRHLRFAAGSAALVATAILAVIVPTLPDGVPSAVAQHNTTLPDLPNPYRTVSDVVRMPEGRVMGSSNAVDVDSRGNIWLFERCGANGCVDSDVDPILKFDPEGNFLLSFGAGMFVFPHGLVVDDEDNIWVVDAGITEGRGSQVLKLSPTGRILLALGQPGVRGDGTGPLLNEPSDVAIAPNGEIYVADGHTSPESNARVARFAPDGRFIGSWGSRGDGPSEFATPHAIAIDGRGRVFVGDRSNNRIQIFTADGALLDEWRQFGRPSGLRIRGGTIYVADSESRVWEGRYGHNPGPRRGIRIGSVDDGRVTAFIPDPDPAGITSFAEGIAVDDDGAIWGASVGGRAVWKWVRE